MLKNYLLLARRNLLQHKGYAAINLFGLGLGLACVLVILLYVQAEWGYDGFHEKGDRIYRVTKTATTQTTETQSASVQLPIGQLLADDFPEIEQRIRLWRDFAPFYNGEMPVVRVGANQYREERFYYADSGFFDVFDFAWVRGDRATALRRPMEVLLTETTARKYFGDADPLGQRLTIVDTGTDFTIVGIVADPPPNSHFKFDFLASFVSLEQGWQANFGMPTIPSSLWTWSNTWVYLLLREGADPGALAAEMEAFVQRHLPENMQRSQAYALQPLSEIHLGPTRNAEFEPGGSQAQVLVFAAIAVFILLIAGINFTNLATAQSLGRAREVGVRKAVGAHRGQLIGQFLGEALLLALGAGVLALAVASLMLPGFNTVMGAQLSLGALASPGWGLGALALVLGVGVLAGAYPAFVLAAFRPAAVLRTGQATGGRRGTALRKALVVVQFVVSIALFVAVGVIYRQVDYLLTKDLGYDASEIVMVKTEALGMGPRYETFLDQMLQHTTIEAATTTESILGRFVYDYYLRPEGMPEDETLSIPFLWTDRNFFEVFGLEFFAGWEATLNHAGLAYVLNEAAVRKLGWDDPLGKRIYREQNGRVVWVGTVTGLVEDFHFRPLHAPIEPLIIAVRPPLNVPSLGENLRSNMGYALFRIRPDDLPTTLQNMEVTWHAATPDERPFEVVFLEENLRAQYQAEQNLQRLVTYFALLAALIAGLGLFGLTAFAAGRRVREIGIRKVLGASAGHIVLLLSKEFFVLVAAACLLAMPLAYLALSAWLAHFPYHAPIAGDLFVWAGLGAFLLAALPLSYHALKAAHANPVHSLRQV